MSEHTPGPWKLDREHSRQDADLTTGAGWFMALDSGLDASCDQDSWDEFWANARLIAAAPDTLAELKRLRQVVLEFSMYAAGGDCPAPGDIDVRLDQTDSVIAKADGHA